MTSNILASPAVAGTLANPSTLDGLSIELKVMILRNHPDILTLHALVRSSPSYHGAYLGQRGLILSELLFRDLGPEAFVEALALQRASEILPIDSYLDCIVVGSFISEYKSLRQDPIPQEKPGLSLNTIISLAYQYYTVSHIASDFCRSRLQFHPFTHEKVDSYAEPSSHERRRIYRALYRFELFRAMFHRQYVGHPDHREMVSEAEDKWFYFLSTFEAWEIEELVCIRDHLTDRVNEILAECHAELSKMSEEYTKSTRYGNIDDIPEHLVSLGLLFLRHLINTPPVDERVIVLKQNIHRQTTFISKGLRYDPYDVMAREGATEAYDCGDELLFQGDNNAKGPNAAWPWSTDFKAEIGYNEPVKGIFRWGYVMWDVERLNGWKVLENGFEETRVLMIERWGFYD